MGSKNIKSVSGGGTGHYIKQRVTAIALIPLTIWFVISVIMILQSPALEIPQFIVSPFNLVVTILFILAFLYHGTLGMQTIIEDYIHCKLLKQMPLISLLFVSIISGVAGCVAIFYLHIVFRIIM